MDTWIRLAGLGQIAIVASSLAIPRVLRWRQQMENVRPLTRQIFWAYSAYICGTNLSFGLVSLLAPAWLVAPTPLAAAVCGFITLYWGARLAIQFLCYDRRDGPQGAVYRLAEAFFVALFAGLTAVYGAAFAAQLA
jgi:hypothetical protein